MANTCRDCFKDTKKRLIESNIKIKDNLIYLILMNVNGFKNYSELFLNFDKTMQNDDIFVKKVDELIKGKPIQYITNNVQFLDLDLYVDERVLIPRPETEGLCSLLKTYINNFNLNRNIIVDCCCGSGCIGLYFQHQYPDSQVLFIDKYKAPIDVTLKNATDLGLNATILKGNKAYPLIKHNIKCDIFISNPPYVENVNDIEDIVKNHEPLNAIYCEDGVEFYRYYFKNHKKFLNDRYVMAFEINYDQEEKLTKLIEKNFKDETIKYLFVKDIYGLTRYLFIFGGYNEIFKED